MSSNIITHLVFFPTTYPMLRASTANFAILSYFTIPKSYFINYTISFYNTPNIPKFYFFLNLFKYSFLFFFLLFLSLSFPFRLSPSTSGTRTNKKIKKQNKKKTTSKVSLGLKHHHHRKTTITHISANPPCH